MHNVAGSTQWQYSVSARCRVMLITAEKTRIWRSGGGYVCVKHLLYTLNSLVTMLKPVWMGNTKIGQKYEHLQFRVSNDCCVMLCSQVITDLECKRANQSVAFASSEQGLTTIRLCSIETPAIFSDFCHFQAGSLETLCLEHFWKWCLLLGEVRRRFTVFTFQKETCNTILWTKLFGLPHSLLNPSQFNKHS